MVTFYDYLAGNCYIQSERRVENDSDIMNEFLCLFQISFNAKTERASHCAFKSKAICLVFIDFSRTQCAQCSFIRIRHSTDCFKVS